MKTECIDLFEDHFQTDADNSAKDQNDKTEHTYCSKDDPVICAGAIKKSANINSIYNSFCERSSWLVRYDGDGYVRSKRFRNKDVPDLEIELIRLLGPFIRIEWKGHFNYAIAYDRHLENEYWSGCDEACIACVKRRVNNQWYGMTSNEFMENIPRNYFIQAGIALRANVPANEIAVRDATT